MSQTAIWKTGRVAAKHTLECTDRRAGAVLGQEC